MMEDYAGELSHTDYNIGRFLDPLEESGQRDDTLVIYMMCDNGASAEGTLQARATRSALPETELRRASRFLLSMIDELGGPRAYNHIIRIKFDYDTLGKGAAAPCWSMKNLSRKGRFLKQWQFDFRSTRPSTLEHPPEPRRWRIMRQDAV